MLNSAYDNAPATTDIARGPAQEVKAPMRLKTLAIASVVLVAAILVPAALAAKHHHPHRYALHGKRCRKGYKRVVKRHGKRRKVFCLAKSHHHPPAKPLGAPNVPRVKLHAHLDPSFVQDPANPFKVTYSYSASATEETAASDLAQTSSETPAPLPSGVLSFFSDGSLECSVNVGGQVTGNECPVTYHELGEHKVTVIYTSGEESATETDTEDISPVATTTEISMSYEPKTEPEKVEGGVYWIGNVDISVSAVPSNATAALACGSLPEPFRASPSITESGCYEARGTVEHVYANPTGGCADPVLGNLFMGQSPNATSPPIPPEAVEKGTYYLRAIVEAMRGYAASEATVPLKFTPEVTFEPDC